MKYSGFAAFWGLMFMAWLLFDVCPDIHPIKVMTISLGFALFVLSSLEAIRGGRPR